MSSEATLVAPGEGLRFLGHINIVTRAAPTGKTETIALLGNRALSKVVESTDFDSWSTYDISTGIEAYVADYIEAGE